MSKKNRNKNEAHVVFNMKVLMFLFFSIIAYTISAFMFKEDTTVGIVLLVFGTIMLLVMFITPAKIIFTNKQLRIIWLLPFEKIIFWSNITTIIENNFFSAIDDFSNFQIFYNTNYKGKSIVKEIQIPRNKKTKLFLDKYAKYKIL